MEELTEYELSRIIAQDFRIDTKKVIKRYSEDFREKTKTGNKCINSSSDSIIVDLEGNEFPYMLSNNQRNDGRLLDFDYIYYIRSKGLLEVCKEAKINLKTQKCKICEGNGWYTQGQKYIYKNNYCEI